MVQDDDEEEAGNCDDREGTAINCFIFVVTEADGKILLEIFGGCVGCDLFKNHSSFCCFPASDFSCNSRCAEEVLWVSQNSHSAFTFLLCHTHIVICSDSPPLSISCQAVFIKVSSVN
jgi:hypothetical protein